MTHRDKSEFQQGPILTKHDTFLSIGNHLLTAINTSWDQFGPIRTDKNDRMRLNKLRPISIGLFLGTRLAHISSKLNN